MRKLLVIGGLVVAALAVVLVFALKKSDDASAQPTSQPKVEPPPLAQHSPSAPTVTPSTPGERPSLPQVAPGENPRDYVVGDTRVRDHRAGDNQPLDVPPNPHPAEARQIPSLLTHEIAQKVKDVMTECTKELPAAARGNKPRLEGQILIAIKDHNVTVTKSTMQLRNVSSESVEPTKQCIESKSVGITNAAPDENDLDTYSINVSFAIP